MTVEVDHVFICCSLGAPEADALTRLGLREGSPNATRTYRPSYLPSGLTIEFADGTSLQEPELFYLPFARRSPPANEPINNLLTIRQLVGVAVGLPINTILSEPSRVAASAASLNYFVAEQHVLELSFAATEETAFDARPELPLVFRTMVHHAAYE